MPKVNSFRQIPNLPELEEATLKFWQENKIFEKSVEQRSKDNAFVFYDGPPFATGMPHYGHLLASTTKDVIPRFQTMLSKRVERVWGWDCHGLPIEHMVEEQLGLKEGKKEIEAMGIAKFNQACRSEVLRLDKEWEKIINRIGRWVDFKNNYKTMDTSYMESVWWGFGQLYKKGLVYEGKKVILYCPHCSTPLANFEIAMDNSYKDITEASTVYKYPVKGEKDTYLLAWSTTPWNKIVTTALAVNPKLTYVKVKQGTEFYIVAEQRLTILKKDEPYEIVQKYQGEELQKLEYELQFDFYPDRQPDERAGVVVADEFVTAEEGTGIVTLAPYGEDDYRVMKAHQVQIILHVDDEGRLKPEVTPWAGMNISEVNRLVNQDLRKRNLIYQDDQYTHSVPVCYRCDTRLYYAPVPAWFIDIQAIKAELIKQNEKINWYPEHLKYGRFLKGLENAPDWNISRSRYWGTPIPIWRGKTQQGEVLTRVISSIEELKKWAVDQAKVANISDIHREAVDELELYVDDEKTVVGQRISEVFDCWVESGSMPFASVHYPFENQEFFEKNYPAQFVSEYIAQTRAWFYTMHVISVGIFNQPTFENVLTTGTILAEDGTKMSKSKKNYPDPMELINQYGADSLRLYLMSSTVMKSENLSFNEKEVADLRRRVFLIWWNIVSFYKLFAHQDHDVSVMPAKASHVMDQWLLSRINSLTTEVKNYMDSYDLIRASRALIEFVNVFSTWYLRLSRERIKSDNNQEVSHVFGAALYRLAQLYAPFTPFFSELIHQNLKDENSSIHLTDWPQVDTQQINQELEQEMSVAMNVVEAGRSLRRDQGVKLRHPLALVKVSANQVLTHSALEKIIIEELNVKQLSWVSSADDQLKVEFDFEITAELKQEAQVRDLIREIQDLRRKAELGLNDQVELALPDWPEKWQAEIEAKTNTHLVKGDKLELILK